MGFIVDFEAMEALHNSLGPQADSWLTRLDQLKQAYEVLSKSSHIKGSGADSLKQYCGSVHLMLIDKLKQLIALHADNYMLYKYDYRDSVDSSGHALIDEDTLDTIQETIEATNKAAIRVNDQLEYALSQIRDIFPYSYQDVAFVDAAHQAVLRHTEEVRTHVNAVEGRHCEADFTNTAQMIAALNAFISELSGKGRSFKETFQADGLNGIGSYQQLMDASVAIEQEHDEKAKDIEDAKQSKDEVIRQYELEHSETAEKIDKLLEHLDETDIREIKYLAYTAPEPFRTIYLNTLDRYSTGDLSGHIDGMYLLDHINVNMAEEAGNPRGPYTTFFHESGHAIDNKFRFFRINESWSHRNEAGQSLMDVIREDVRADVTATVEMYTTDPDMQKHLVEYIMGHDKGAFSSLTPDEQDLMTNSIRPYYSRILAGEVNEAASDVYGGITNNIIIGSYGHTQGPYWYILGQPTYFQPMELWAEYFSYGMTNNQAAMQSLRERFPEAIQFLDEIAASMAEELSP